MGTGGRAGEEDEDPDLAAGVSSLIGRLPPRQPRPAAPSPVVTEPAVVEAAPAARRRSLGTRDLESKDAEVLAREEEFRRLLHPPGNTPTSATAGSPARTAPRTAPAKPKSPLLSKEAGANAGRSRSPRRPGRPRIRPASKVTGTRQSTMWLPKELHDRVGAYAERTGMQSGQVLMTALHAVDPNAVAAQVDSTSRYRPRPVRGGAGPSERKLWNFRLLESDFAVVDAQMKATGAASRAQLATVVLRLFLDGVSE